MQQTRYDIGAGRKEGERERGIRGKKRRDREKEGERLKELQEGAERRAREIDRQKRG